MEELLMNAGLTTTGVAVLLILYKVFKNLEGKKLVSSCCGKKTEIGFQVGEMTPQVNPMLVQPAPIIQVHT